jgi:hypothetical protein
MKHKAVFAFAAASMMSLGAMAQAVISAEVAPPAPIAEAVPAPRAGFTWSPGHYTWRDGSYTWVSGQWIADRPGYAWAPPHWVQRTDGTWTLAGGAWLPRGEAVAVTMARDRDRDGTADLVDDDKDNDGVPNRYDSHPNNRWRD